MDNNEEIKVASQLIVKDFNTEELYITDKKDELFERVKRKISELLDTDMQSLMNIFYRLDLNEEKVKQIITFSKPDNVSTELAEEVIKREIEKAKTRIKYRKRNS